MKIFKNISDVVSWRLCLGCGACYSACKNESITLYDVESDGIRPWVDNRKCQNCYDCLKSCPGHDSSRTSGSDIEPERINNLYPVCGTVLEVLEGYSSEIKVRNSGSSGGLISGLARYMLDQQGLAGVVHIMADSQVPWKNQTVISTETAQILERTGSRYSPASPCDILKIVEKSKGTYLFVGKPCDVAGLERLKKIRPDLEKKIVLSLACFCAGTPSTDATLQLLKSSSLKTHSIQSIRYRGKGWPGNFAVWNKGEQAPALELSYERSWGFLQAFRPFRCSLCPDGTGEVADISFGDAWGRLDEEASDGISIALIRSSRGRDIIHNAINAGYLNLQKVDPQNIIKYQENLLRKRKTIHGRLVALKMLGIPTPKYDGWPLLESWKTLLLRESLRVVAGTMKRAIIRKYYLRNSNMQKDHVSSQFLRVQGKLRKMK